MRKLRLPHLKQQRLSPDRVTPGLQEDWVTSMEEKQREKAFFGEETNAVRKSSGGPRIAGKLGELVTYNSNSIQKYDGVVPGAACNWETHKAQGSQTKYTWVAIRAQLNSKIEERNVSFFEN